MSVFKFLESVGKMFSDGGVSEKNLKKELDSYNLGTEDVQVSLDGGKVSLAGSVKDQSIFEKALLAVGNIVGVSEVQAANLKVGGEAAAEAVLYTVKSGDNLWKIAEAHYGKGKGDKHTLIFEANRPMLVHPDKIYPGQVLRIPSLG